MNKRHIFDEPIEGMSAWSDLNAGKSTRRTHRVT